MNDSCLQSPIRPRAETSKRVALITGGSRGLGATVARLLADQDHVLILTARGTEGLSATAHELSELGATVVALAGDVTDPAHRRALAEAARDLGRLDLLINNASALGATPLPPLAEYPLDTLERAYSTNVLAPLALIQENLPLLTASGGLVVNISSDAARGGYPGWGGYGGTKAALDLVSLTLAGELEGQGVAVVSVDPGDLRTHMHLYIYIYMHIM